MNRIHMKTIWIEFSTTWCTKRHIKGTRKEKRGRYQPDNVCGIFGGLCRLYNLSKIYHKYLTLVNGECLWIWYDMIWNEHVVFFVFFIIWTAQHTQRHCWMITRSHLWWGEWCKCSVEESLYHSMILLMCHSLCISFKWALLCSLWLLDCHWCYSGSTSMMCGFLLLSLLVLIYSIYNTHIIS